MYFYNLSSVDEIRRMYLALVKEYHPSLPHGNVNIMRQVAKEYHAALKSVSGQITPHGRYFYNQENEFAAAKKLGECISTGLFHHSRGLEINIVGTWIWATGNTYTNRAELAKLGFFHRQHGANNTWMWKPYSTKYHRALAA